MKHHPEQLDDEIYMGNRSKRRHEHYIQGDGWKTERLGNVGLDSTGKPLVITDPSNPPRPVFIQRSEVEAMIESTKPRAAQQDFDGKMWQSAISAWKQMLERGSVL